VETNFVQVDVGALGLTATDALDRLRANGVGLSATIHPNLVRALTHLHIGDEDVERAVEGAAAALVGATAGARSA
jgi:hypothetical protein